MRIAHVSDPHLLDLTGVRRSRLLLNKRLTGMVNIKLHRGGVHKREVVEAMMDDIRALRVDHVVITGDITNLALEPEFELAVAVFLRMGLHADQVSVVPGNHDVYTQGAQRSQRFAGFFAANITSDLTPADRGDHPSGPFPFVRLRGEVAIIGLSTAVARLPLFASGHAGDKQLESLARMLEHPEVARRTPVILTHHPLVNPQGFVGTFTHGLAEAARIRKILQPLRHSIVLHGHLHDRGHRVLESGGSTLHH
ncbi:MAG: metallophosphoesterase, partial [Deltaproteobacteria bacterium]